MRVLFLFGHNDKSDATRLCKRVHIDFIKKLIPHVREFHVYGPRAHFVFPHCCPVRFDEKKMLRSVVREIQPDVILAYSFFTLRWWLPPDINLVKVPKAIIEVDYYVVQKRWPDWYKGCGWDLLMQRAYYPQNPIQSVWLPFSASEEFVPFQNWWDRKAREIAFVGQWKVNGYYQHRREVLHILGSHRLIRNLGPVGHDPYPRTLARFRYCFADAGRFHTTMAKVFEIMATGNILLTQWQYGEKQLFGDDPPYVKYRDNLKDLIPIARSVKAGKYNDLRHRATEIVNRQHLDQHRITELQEILWSLTKGREVPRKWSH